MDWPGGHVSVVPDKSAPTRPERLRLADIQVLLTDESDEECVVVLLGGHRHYLHSTTARVLSDELLRIERSATITIHQVKHSAGRNVTSALGKAIQRRLAEWNRIHEGERGWLRV